jgi:type II secretory pathway pseudopilin PulG
MTGHGQHGFTLLEVFFVAVLGMLTFAGAGAVFQGADRLSQSSQLRLRALGVQRANMAALARVLQGIQGSSLGGFSADGTSAAPTFQRVAGATGDQVTLGPPESLEWRAELRDVDGVTSPGGVYLGSPSGDRRIAVDVPAGGFLVRQEGSALTVRLTTFHSSSRDRVVELSTTFTIALRN